MVDVSCSMQYTPIYIHIELLKVVLRVSTVQGIATKDLREVEGFLKNCKIKTAHLKQTKKLKKFGASSSSSSSRSVDQRVGRSAASICSHAWHGGDVLMSSPCI